MKVRELVAILLRAPQEAVVNRETDDCWWREVEYVALREGQVIIGDGYGSEATFWLPGNGNLAADVKLLGHCWGTAGAGSTDNPNRPDVPKLEPGS